MRSEVSGKPVVARTASLGDVKAPGSADLHCTLHSHNLPSTDVSGLVVTRSPAMKDSLKAVLYLYSFLTNDEVLETVHDFYPSFLFP